MSLGLLDATLAADDTAKPLAREARQAATSALEELRLFSQGMYPSVLAERGLVAALHELREHAPVLVHLELALSVRLPAQVEAAAYFLISEALANVAKHAHASAVRVAASDDGHLVNIEVADSGIGGAAATRGSGLRNMTDRVEALGGELMISSRPGAGTAIRAKLPCG